MTNYVNIRELMCKQYDSNYFINNFDISNLPHCSLRSNAVKRMLNASTDDEFEENLNLLDEVANRYTNSSAKRVYFLYAIIKAYYTFKREDNKKMVNILGLVITIATHNDCIDQ